VLLQKHSPTKLTKIARLKRLFEGAPLERVIDAAAMAIPIVLRNMSAWPRTSARPREYDPGGHAWASATTVLAHLGHWSVPADVGSAFRLPASKAPHRVIGRHSSLLRLGRQHRARVGLGLGPSMLRRAPCMGLVRAAGVEPALHWTRILNPVRLPIPPRPHLLVRKLTHRKPPSNEYDDQELTTRSVGGMVRPCRTFKSVASTNSATPART
jgi:hypothetical protein